MLNEPGRGGRSAGNVAACVLGDIDLVRALALGGVHVAVMARATAPSRYSRATAEVLEWADARTQPELRVERLLQFAAGQRRPPSLFYDGDWDLLLISRHRDRLAAALRFVVADAALVEALVDKERFAELAEARGLPVPRARRLAAGDTAAARSDLRFPVAVKPLTRHQSTWSTLTTAKAIRVREPAGLEAVAERLASAGVDALVQEAVEGPESRIESYHVYVDATGGIAAEFTGRKLRTHPARYGYTTALEITDREDVRSLGREIVERLELTGVAKLDLKRDAEGRLHLLEVNPRFSLWHHPGAIAGVNIPAIVHADLMGLPRPPARTARAGVRWCSPGNDLRAARREGWSVPRWFGWVARCEARSGFAWDDPAPLLRGLAARLVAPRR